MSMLKADFLRAFRLMRSYWINYLGDIVLYALGFGLIMALYVVAVDGDRAKLFLSTLIGYLIWKVGASVMAEVAEISIKETRTGTLEQLVITGRSTIAIFLSRSTIAVVEHLLRAGIIAMILLSISGYSLRISPVEMLILGITIAGAVGLGLALAGLVVVFKQVGALVNFTWQMLIFFSGALAPFQEGSVFQSIAQFLPLSWGIAATRSLAIDGLSFPDLMQNGQFLGLVINTAAYLFVGIVVFRWEIDTAKNRGELAHY